jgi:hypothetical protein
MKRVRNYCLLCCRRKLTAILIRFFNNHFSLSQCIVICLERLIYTYRYRAPVYIPVRSQLPQERSFRGQSIGFRILTLVRIDCLTLSANILHKRRAQPLHFSRPPRSELNIMGLRKQDLTLIASYYSVEMMLLTVDHV